MGKGYCRVKTDYIGAGRFIALEDSSVVVNTQYGVQCLCARWSERWRADLGSRCIGLARGPGGEIFAACLKGVHALDTGGKKLWSVRTRKELAHAPTPFAGGVVVTTINTVHLIRDERSAWRYDARDALGTSVRVVLPCGAFVMGDLLVLGLTDYDTGVGRCVALDGDGGVRWMTDPGPLVYLYPITEEEFILALSGYLQFESRCLSLGAEERWRVDFAGPGVPLGDGRIAMLVGNNESPTWDRWELRLMKSDGSVEHVERTIGHAGGPPIVDQKGRIYFSTYFKPIDPDSTRMDYTSFFPHPQFLSFDHIMGAKQEIYEYDVYYFSMPPGGPVERLLSDSGSSCFGPAVDAGDAVVFSHGRDLVGFPKG